MVVMLLLLLLSCCCSTKLGPSSSSCDVDVDVMERRLGTPSP
jgi:hypothetical protein